jgi:hypothetical protein
MKANNRIFVDLEFSEKYNKIVNNRNLLYEWVKTGHLNQRDFNDILFLLYQTTHNGKPYKGYTESIY